MSESLAALVRFVASELGQAHGPNTMDPPPFVISAQQAHDWSKALYQAVGQIENLAPDGHSNLPPYDAESEMDELRDVATSLETEVDDRTRERDAAMSIVCRFIARLVPGSVNDATLAPEALAAVTAWGDTPGAVEFRAKVTAEARA